MTRRTRVCAANRQVVGDGDAAKAPNCSMLLWICMHWGPRIAASNWELLAAAQLHAVQIEEYNGRSHLQSLGGSRLFSSQMRLHPRLDRW